MTKLKRNAEKVLSFLTETDNNQLVCQVACKIQAPARFFSRNLGEIGARTYVYGFVPIILETGEYAVLNICGLIEINPYKTINVKIDGVDYVEFQFEAGQIIIPTLSVVKRNIIMYDIFDEFLAKGKIPWYVEYTDLCKMFDTSNEYSGTSIGKSHELIELFASIVTRSKNDRSKYLRATAENEIDFNVENTTYVPMASVFYSSGSTLNKIAGNYFSDGVVSALVNPTDSVEKIESILRA